MNRDYYYISNPLSAYAYENKTKLIRFDADNSDLLKKFRIGFFTKDTYRTGLVSPLCEMLGRFILVSSDHDYSLLVDPNEINHSLTKLNNVEQGQKLRLLKDLDAINNTYLTPQKIIIPKGEVILARQGESSRFGEYNFSYNGHSVSLVNAPCPYPYSLPVFSPNCLELT